MDRLRVANPAELCDELIGRSVEFFQLLLTGRTGLDMLLDRIEPRGIAAAERELAELFRSWTRCCGHGGDSSRWVVATTVHLHDTISYLL